MSIFIFWVMMKFWFAVTVNLPQPSPLTLAIFLKNIIFDARSICIGKSLGVIQIGVHSMATQLLRMVNPP